MRIFIIVILLLISHFTYGNQSILCASCTTQSAAKSLAIQYPPELNCRSDFGGQPYLDNNIQCSSIEKKVIIVNANNGQVFAFNVQHDDYDPWTVRARSTTTTADDRYAYSEIAKFYRGLIGSIDEAQRKNHSTYTSQNLVTSPSKLEQLTNMETTSSDTCPTVDTALDTLFDPDKFEHLKKTITASIALHQVGGNNKTNLNPNLNSDTIGATYKGFNYSSTIGKQTRKPIYVETYQISENPGMIQDVLVFDVEIRGYNAGNFPIIRLELDESTSRVGGYSLPGIQGKHGRLNITNKCLKDKLKKLLDEGKVTRVDVSNSSTGSGGGLDDGSFDLGSGTGSQTRIGSRCKRYDYYTNGRLTASVTECD